MSHLSTIKAITRDVAAYLHRKLKTMLSGTYRYNQPVRSYNFSKFLVIIPILITILAIVNARQPDHTATAEPERAKSRTSESKLPLTSSTYRLASNDIAWPAVGKSAVGVYGSGVLAESHPDDPAVPMASLAKVMTALLLLDAHPLALGEQGPDVPFTAQDEVIYGEYIARNGSVLPVLTGDNMSLYNIIQALLIRSANNYADSATNWAFGGLDSFLQLSRDKTQALDLPSMELADTTGFSPQTKSTPRDMVLLGEYAMSNPVIADIVRKWEAELPGIGTIYNTNNFLDFENNGVVGIKTGDTDEAGGTYLVAARRIVDNEEVLIIASVLGGENHFSAQATAMPLIDDVASKLERNP